MFLWHREYDGSSFDKNNVIKGPDNLKYIINAEWNKENKVVSIIIKMSRTGKIYMV